MFRPPRIGMFRGSGLGAPHAGSRWLAWRVPHPLWGGSVGSAPQIGMFCGPPLTPAVVDTCVWGVMGRQPARNVRRGGNVRASPSSPSSFFVPGAPAERLRGHVFHHDLDLVPRHPRCGDLDIILFSSPFLNIDPIRQVMFAAAATSSCSTAVNVRLVGNNFRGS